MSLQSCFKFVSFDHFAAIRWWTHSNKTRGTQKRKEKKNFKLALFNNLCYFIRESTKYPISF